MSFSQFFLYLHSLLALVATKSSSESSCESLAVGGQAVMEGIMMRNGASLALAIRKPDGSIIAFKRKWATIFSTSLTQKKWIRGFPVLIETLVNGVKALNLSAEISAREDAQEIKPWHLVLSLIFAACLAVLFFIVVPHVLTIGLGALSIAGGVEGISFHIWDGIIKMAIFVGYIIAISQLEDIRRVFQYHGAEHKTISAYEHGEDPVTPASAAGYSRLHPRCGTTFMLFVVVISILIHTMTVPAFLWVWTPQSAIVKHTVVLLFKFLLVIPISALAYEAIRAAATVSSPLLGTISRGPGLLLQALTTREPDYQQLEVGLVALKEALGESNPVAITTPDYDKAEMP